MVSLINREQLTFKDDSIIVLKLAIKLKPGEGQGWREKITEKVGLGMNLNKRSRERDKTTCSFLLSTHKEIIDTTT